MTTYAEHESAALRAEQRQDWLDAASHWQRAASAAVGTRTRERALQFHDEALAHAQRLGQLAEQLAGADEVIVTLSTDPEVRQRQIAALQVASGR